MLLEDDRLVLRVLVEPDLADAEHSRLVDELRDHLDDFTREFDVFGFLGVDAEPSVVLDAGPTGALRLEFGELPEVVAEAVHTATIEAGPERRLADGHAAHPSNPLVVVGHAGNHVDVRVDVVHSAVSLEVEVVRESEKCRVTSAK
ncbi:MAG: hypothetical protein FD138_1469 [Planctomycetota bacterium]|nr:MAG: hypothetical protein FD138_1469 [Planctomycetota bacterium]